MEVYYCKIFILFFVPFLFLLTTYEVFGEIEFKEVSENANMIYKGGSWSSAWTDFNGDGFPDLLTVNHGQGTNLFLNNRNGSFTNISSTVMENMTKRIDAHGSAWADFDNDGDKDLMILVGADKGTGQSPNKFFVNENGILIDKALEYGLEYSHGRGRHPLWFDFDNDGFLDIMIFNSPRQDNKAPTAIFRQAENSFVDITKDSEIKIKKSVTLGQIGNIYGNLPMELIYFGPADKLLNVPLFSSVPKLWMVPLFLMISESMNVPVLKLENVRWFSIVPADSDVYELSDMPFKNMRSIMSIPKGAYDLTTADFNGDLSLDIFVTRLAHKTNATVAETSRDDYLLINSGGKFIDNTSLSGIKNPTSCHSSGLGDFDNDMDVDIYLVCTLVGNNLPNLLYENLGDGTFTVVPDAGGAEGSKLGIGDAVSVADYNNDGFLDLFVTNGWGGDINRLEGPIQLFENQGNDNHWIEIDLEGTKSNRDAIGSRIFVTSGNVTQIREQTNGSHYHSQDFQRIHFGLKEFSNIDKILVFWPSGMISELYNIESNQILKIVEPPK